MPVAATNSFDFIAPVYDTLAGLVYGQAQKKAQAHFLSLIPPGAKVLILGGGSGWIIPELIRKATPASVLFLEASVEMLYKAEAYFRQQLPSSLYPVEFRHGTEDALQASDQFDVVMTPFVLDLFTFPEMQQIMQKLNHALYPGGLWLHTDFYSSTALKHRIWQQPMLWGMYRFFRLASRISAHKLPAFESAFQQLGYSVQQVAYFYGHFIRAQVLQKS